MALNIYKNLKLVLKLIMTTFINLFNILNLLCLKGYQNLVSKNLSYFKFL